MRQAAASPSAAWVAFSLQAFWRQADAWLRACTHVLLGWSGSCRPGLLS